jgi:DNA-binding winged helix-turn-helix (wHTH) protein/TolB-like protein/Flp pilus assembly protein TadD
LPSTIPQSGSIASGARHFYEFGPFRLDVLNSQLHRDGQPLPLTPKAIDMLLLLVRQQGRVIEKRELMKALWPDSFVEEANLSQHVFMLRRTLGTQANGKPYIETVARRGYYFAAEVREIREAAAGASVSTTDANALSSAPSPPLPERPWALRLVYAIVLVGVFMGAVYVATRGGTRTPDTPPPRDSARPIRSIAVLPFKPLHKVEGDDYLGLGLADALITKLGKLRQIDVRPTGAVRRYADSDKGSVAAGRELGVDAVLEGNFQQEGARLRITVQLVSVRDASPRWTHTFDTPWTDSFSVQDAISQELARALALTLTSEEKQLLAKPYTESARAHELYLRSRYFWNKRNAEAFRQAIEYGRQAIAEDPAYALAYAGLADSYALLGSQGVGGRPRGEAMVRAKEAARKALALDETLAEAHTSLAYVLMHYDWNWRESEKEFRRAIELNPSYPTAHHWYAYHLTAQRRHDEAITEIHRAQQLDPLSLIINTDRAEIYYFARRYDEAVAYARQTLEIEPDFPLARRILGWALLQQGHYDTAVDEFRRAAQGHPELNHSLAYAFAAAGRRAEARRVLREMEREHRPRYGQTLWLAIPRAVLGEADEAFEWLEKAYSERDGTLILLSAAPFFDPIRADPRFAELARRIGLPLLAP